MNNPFKHGALVLAAAAVSGVGALLFALPAAANVDSKTISCDVGTETAWSGVQATTGLWSETDEMSPAQCADTYLHVDFQYGNSTWQSYSPPWSYLYTSVTWHKPFPSLVLGPVTAWGSHNTCASGYTSCNGYVDTSAAY